MWEVSAKKTAQETTLDGFLNNRIVLEQPADGYRAAVDTVLLAAAVPAHVGEKVLDLGCGAGGAMLCLAARVPGISTLGVEIQNELRLLCRDNIMRNGLKANLAVQDGDATVLSSALSGFFDHVIMNPPYHDEARHDVSPHAQKRIANTEKSGDLALWLANAVRALKPSGCLTLIHRADRLEEILACVSPASCMVEIFDIIPKAGMPPKRVIVCVHKGVTPSLLQKRDFILHRSDGRYTDEAESVLRNGAALG